MSANVRKSRQEQEAAWKQWLSDERSPTELVLDAPRMPAPSYYRESCSEQLSAERVAQLAATAERMETDLGTLLLSGFCAVAARYGGSSSALVGVVAAATDARPANPLPLDVELEGDPTALELVRRVSARLQALEPIADYPADDLAALAGSHQALYRLMFRTEGIAFALAGAGADTDAGSHGAECDLVLTAVAEADGLELRLDYDADLFEEASARSLLSAFGHALNSLQDPARKLSELSLLSDQERLQILQDWNATRTAFPADRCVHQLFEAQVEATPDAPALAFCGELLTYQQLNARANRLAHLLIARGVRPDDMVGLWLERGIELVTAVLAVLKAGCAYVPMDPHYPMDRVTYMAVDSGAPLVLTAGEVQGELDAPSAKLLRLEDLKDDLLRQPTTNPVTTVGPQHLAYVIYTSGSTGKPKGVMVEHHNVVNFFTGMDDRLQTTPGHWLAVTSLSFDISVLELLWTLARGFQVVLFSTSQQRDPAPAPGQVGKSSKAVKKIDFDLFYFASDEGHATTPGRDRYRLLIEGAKFGDSHGFNAVWTPERHFDTFGGLYPSPAVAGGALSMVTERIKIRAGSVVLPLHDAVRVAEELQLIDNLSGGRAGVAFTTGWQPDDFVLAPQAYADRQQVTYDAISLIHSLWKGESTTRKNGVGRDYTFKTLPKPVQPELPTWLTCGGGLPGFVKAGELGLNVLTHLLGQTIEELATKLEAYRAARKKAGHTGPGYVSLMLHTYLSDDPDAVFPAVHEPFKNYLRGSQALFAGFAKELGIDMNNLTDEDRETLAEFSFKRYYETSGLFGTPESCKGLVERLAAIGVDSLACLIDFGIGTDQVLDGLRHLDTLRQACESVELVKDTARGSDAPYSIQGLIQTHGVTHLQCTPSMCSMLLADPEVKAALATVDNLMIGGEAFPRRLASELKTLNPRAQITNMYGPTETTIWSSTHAVGTDDREIPIGRPIANTQLYVLDANKQPVPPGVPGQLYIGGEGVVRGYHGRAELTAERFVADPFAASKGARMYWTGDLARFRNDGVVDFLGRGDNQVKFRGFRIELGEIETALISGPEIAEAVVLVREDTPGDKRLVAYVVPAKGKSLDVAALRERLKGTLTEFMIPTAYVAISALPLTPNAKVDRKALPVPTDANELASSQLVAPANELEETIAAIWCQVLKVQRVGTKDSFFDLGGHSVLVVQVLNQLRELGYELAMTDLFQYPTVSSLAQFISPDGEQASAAQEGADRAAARRARMGRRRKARP